MLAFSTSGYVCSTGAREVFRNPLSCFMSNPWIISTGFPLTKGKQPGGVLAWKATKQFRKGVNLSEDVSQFVSSPQLGPIQYFIKTNVST